MMVPFSDNASLRPETKLLTSGTCAKTLFPKIRSAFFSVFAKDKEKKSSSTSIPFSRATFAVLLVGSTPKQGISFSLKYCNR